MTTSPDNPVPGDHATPAHKTPDDWLRVGKRLEQAVAAARADRTPDERAAVLRRRTALFARPLPSAEPAVDQVECLGFDLAGQTYAIDQAAASEAVQCAVITPLPGLDVPLRGLVNVRSRIVPAYDLRPILRLPPAEPRDRETVLIVHAGDAEFGLLVDAVRGRHPIRSSGIRRDVAGLHSQYLRGIADDGTLLLDLSALRPALTVEERGA